MDNNPSSEIVPFGGADALTTRESVVAARTELARRQLQLSTERERATAELERKRKELDADFARQRAELEALMAPLKEQLEKMAEVLWTVDLYLGRDETLQLVRDGAPAPADEPITVRQKVLVMAEESLIMMGKRNTGMDADDIPHFIEWLASDDANLNRVIPERKSVVVLIPTRVQSRSGNAWEDAARDAQNTRSYWLLRNGERLYLLTVDPQLKVGDRVLPRRREFVEVFDRGLFGFGRRSGEPVRPGSDEWFEIEKRADARRRHYMRIMLVLQGLIDRTPVWHPLPPAGVSFLSIADQDAGKIVLLQDDESSIQLGEGGETFLQWQTRLNKLLRPGLRVIGNWHTRDFSELYYDGDRFTRGSHPRLHPGNAEYPPTNEPHLIEGRRDGGFVIRYERTDGVYKRNQPVPDKPGWVYTGETRVDAKQRASCVVQASDSWVLPFDLVTVPELERFLYSREERSKHFLSMVPTVRAALEAKRAEAALEADFRGLIGQLLVAEGADAEGISEVVDDLVHWWKLAHTWTQPLNGDGAHERKAAEQIVAEYRSRRAGAVDTLSDAMVDAGRAVDGVIAVARDRRGRWHAYAPSPGAHDEHVYLDVTRIYRDGTLGTPATWQVLATRTASALQVAWKAPGWDTWTFGAHPAWYLDEPSRARLIADIQVRVGERTICVTEFFNPADPGTRAMFAYSWVPEHLPSDHPARATDSPFGWRDASATIERQGWVITRSADGAPQLGARSGRKYTGAVPSDFGGFTTSEWGDVPWYPSGERYGEARPRLVWLNEELFHQVVAYRSRCEDLLTEEQAARRAREKAADRFIPGVMDLIRARQLSEIRRRFEEDFGSEADDLWEAHVASLRLSDPIHWRDIHILIAQALDRGETVDGRTLAQLLASSTFTTDLGEYGDIAVPEPTPR
ncbi:MAG: hypothetical protein CMH36_01135 [Microbacterium sp.]|uniref:OmpH family outer membrane protein n=1 Tax=Microbacterium sp. 4NA327F11 TaxID=2502229 RepID=UPI000C95101D|nr:OmpH family outer membrane protein [Microbacterium sp. 4NA327F11]MAL05452.1 hypothetical protein [Microbacterium sp.]